MSEMTVVLDVSERAFLHLYDRVAALGQWSVITRLNSGFLRAMLAIDEDGFDYAEAQAEEAEYAGPEDYVDAELYAALQEIGEAICEEPQPLLPFAVSLAAESRKSNAILAPFMAPKRTQ